MRDARWKPLPAVLIFLGLGLMLLATLIGFVRLLLHLALPLGVLLLVVGVVWLFLKSRPSR